jgi:site-specific DNA recombinase
LGFDTTPEGGRIVVNKDEAEQVRAIFGMYAESPSLITVAEELNQKAWHTKSWTTKAGKVRNGQAWTKASVRTVLRNRLYVGMMTLGDETFLGEHPAIVPTALFNKVQELLDGNRASGGAGARNDRAALLRGLLFCDACGTSMSYNWTKSRYGRTYRYYRCNGSMRRGGASCPTGSVPASKVENFVVDRIKCIGTDPVLRQETFRQALAQLKAERRGLAAEAKRLEREIPKVRREVETLVRTLTDANGATRDAVNGELAKAQERLQNLEHRRAEVAEQQQALAAQQTDEADLTRALEAFNPVWDELWTSEKERVLNLLIDQVRYDGGTGRLEIDFKLSGIAALAEEMNGAA